MKKSSTSLAIKNRQTQTTLNSQSEFSPQSEWLSSGMKITTNTGKDGAKGNSYSLPLGM
jgi:hypothetical protein